MYYKWIFMVSGKENGEPKQVGVLTETKKMSDALVELGRAIMPSDGLTDKTVRSHLERYHDYKVISVNIEN
ncbi:MAG: hypothetical protein PHN37_00010 [Candidatus Pacebacteria bacterium]|nr:hypothetical protein [Candidatus Paceibacterota bacterium]